LGSELVATTEEHVTAEPMISVSRLKYKMLFNIHVMSVAAGQSLIGFE
jgi:hypothetical protein